jgi:hypothetical protein
MTPHRGLIDEGYREPFMFQKDQSFHLVEADQENQSQQRMSFKNGHLFSFLLLSSLFSCKNERISLALNLACTIKKM